MSSVISAHRRTAAPASLGAALARRRIDHRIARIERVLAALRDRALYRESRGEVPRPLRQAIAGFSAELGELRRRRAEL
ncbi:MAG TPA: hypothetical protein VFR97_03720 [Capillimicrobium sp.]|nr:hypothetical protein [Capillimicrobium sp.]